MAPGNTASFPPLRLADPADVDRRVKELRYIQCHPEVDSEPNGLKGKPQAPLHVKIHHRLVSGQLAVTRLGPARQRLEGRSNQRGDLPFALLR